MRFLTLLISSGYVCFCRESYGTGRQGPRRERDWRGGGGGLQTEKKCFPAPTFKVSLGALSCGGMKLAMAGVKTLPMF